MGCATQKRVFGNMWIVKAQNQPAQLQGFIRQNHWILFVCVEVLWPILQMFESMFLLGPYRGYSVLEV